ncbi:hypothetical protein AB0K52_19365 [Glycomyces sp. NPDC049804]|uniref:hypothetical protein n=1 Tax=Glycomyces sp. NPDC049804 TaxID=3154363 RepID=UPI003438D306
MAHRSIGFVHAANWAFAAILGFLFTIHWDEQVPLTVASGITVSEGESTEPSESLRPAIAAFALEHQITFAEERRDFDDWQGGRVLYLVDGDPAVPGADWLAGGFDDFSRSVDTQVRPYDALDGDAAGNYAVFGAPEKARELADFLESQGLRTDRFETTAWETVLELVDRSMSSALSMMLLVAAAIVGAGVLLGTRAYGIGRLQGLPFGSLLLGDLRRVAKVWVTAGAATLATALAALAFYNGLVGIGRYVAVVLCLVLVLTSAAVAAHAVMLLLTMQVRILASVKGELPGRTAAGVAYTLRLVTVVIALALVSQAFALGSDLAQRDRVFDDYARLGDTASITVGLGSIEEEEAMVRVVGSWLRREDQAGRLLLAGERVLPSADPALAAQPVLYVNDLFLEEQRIELADGGTAAPGGATPRVLVPAGLWDRGDEVVGALAADVIWSDPDTLAAVRPVQTRGGQAVFTYNTTGGAGRAHGQLQQDETYATDPVIVVVPAASGLLNDDGYLQFATGRSALFPDPAAVEAALEQDPELARFIMSATPVAAGVAAEHQDLLREFRLNLFSAFAAALVLVVTGIGTVLVHTRQHAQWIFARHVNGWRYTAVHRLLMSFELGVLLVLLAWLPYQVWSQNREIHRMYGERPPFATPTLGVPEWTSMGLLGLVAVGGVIAALAFTHRRVVRDGASEA